MVTGRAFLVSHPRRHEQDYVCLSMVEVARDLVSKRRIQWKVEVRLLNFHGEGALSITTDLLDIVSEMDEEQQKFFKVQTIRKEKVLVMVGGVYG